jgi:hypothetical protein
MVLEQGIAPDAVELDVGVAITDESVDPVAVFVEIEARARSEGVALAVRVAGAGGHGGARRDLVVGIEPEGAEHADRQAVADGGIDDRDRHPIDAEGVVHRPAGGDLVGGFHVVDLRLGAVLRAGLRAGGIGEGRSQQDQEPQRA